MIRIFKQHMSTSEITIGSYRTTVEMPGDALTIVDESMADLPSNCRPSKKSPSEMFFVRRQQAAIDIR
jgi:hypothetical protein